MEEEGIDLCRMMRQVAPDAAIVLISDRDPGQPWLVDQHVPPTAANDALTRALVTARSQASTRLLKAGDFTLDRVTGELKGPAGTHELSPKLAQLMVFFMQHPGRVMCRQTIMQQVWNTTYLGDTRTLDVHVCMLRRCVEPNAHEPRYLVTCRNSGYRFNPLGEVQVQP